MTQRDKNPGVIVRWCRDDELAWINQQYDALGFVPSTLGKDRVAIAAKDGDRVGLARVCRVDEHSVELGGMHVLPAYRGQGIARSLLRFLLVSCVSDDDVYCLPYAHLKEFYMSEGFVEVEPGSMAGVPADVVAKHRWGNEFYEHEVLLLILGKEE